MEDDKGKGKEEIELRVYIPEIVAIFFDKKTNTWYVQGATDYDFSRARGSCKVCYGTGQGGYTDVTMQKKEDGSPFPGKIRVICRKCKDRMKKPENELREGASEPLKPEPGDKGRPDLSVNPPDHPSKRLFWRHCLIALIGALVGAGIVLLLKYLGWA